MHTIPEMVNQKFQIIPEIKSIRKLKERKARKLPEDQQLKAKYAYLKSIVKTKVK